jgi:hypothetical protein
LVLKGFQRLQGSFATRADVEIPGDSPYSKRANEFVRYIRRA